MCYITVINVFMFYLSIAKFILFPFLLVLVYV